LLRLFPPLRAVWAVKGTQATVPITGANAKLRIPTESSRPFRRKPAGDSDGNQPPIPRQTSHP
jgi:hypothetical protein